MERELTKEGHDRESLGHDAFVERVRGAEAQWRADAADLLTALHVGFGRDLEYASTDTPAVVAAARVAFVRLFDAGVLELADHVVDVCPRCATVVHAADAEPATIGAEMLTVRLPASGAPAAPGAVGHVDVRVLHPELLPGAVGVLVPPGHLAEGRRVILPTLARSVPVIADADAREPQLLVPAHDPQSHAVARREGLPPVEVLAADGTVREPRDLAGLPRFGARAETAARLEAEGAVVARDDVDDTVAQCRGCGTVLVPRLGRHWFLRTAELEYAAADAVRQGTIAFSPPAARQDFVNWVGYSGTWCISHQLWGGHAVPVALCTDCGEPAVGIHPPSVCRKCMAPLAPETSVFDARFLGVIWSLVAAGWPGDTATVHERSRHTTLAVRPLGLFSWAVPAAALGLRLAGVVPFSAVVVHEATEAAPFAGAVLTDVAALRLGLLAGTTLEEARDLAARLARPADGAADLDALEAALAGSFADMRPVAALPALAAALAEGIPATGRGRLGRITAPLTG